MEISLQLISIPGRDNKNRTISVCPVDDAISKGVWWIPQFEIPLTKSILWNWIDNNSIEILLEKILSKMFWQLISIPALAERIWTISKFPFDTAILKGVLF